MLLLNNQNPPSGLIFAVSDRADEKRKQLLKVNTFTLPQDYPLLLLSQKCGCIYHVLVQLQKFKV